MALAVANWHCLMSECDWRQSFMSTILGLLYMQYLYVNRSVQRKAAFQNWKLTNAFSSRFRYSRGPVTSSSSWTTLKTCICELMQSWVFPCECFVSFIRMKRFILFVSNSAWKKLPLNSGLRTRLSVICWKTKLSIWGSWNNAICNAFLRFTHVVMLRSSSVWTCHMASEIKYTCETFWYLVLSARFQTSTIAKTCMNAIYMVTMEQNMVHEASQ